MVSSSSRHRSRSPFERTGRPLDAVSAAFDWLTLGPQPVAIDGRLFPGLPHRPVAVDELRDRLLDRGCSQQLRDAVWAHLVLRSRTEGATWTVACAGIALPGLAAIAARLTARFRGERDDIHAAVLAGFMAELARIDLLRPRIMLRLRWAAYRAGHACLREALDAPTPTGNGFCSTEPHLPYGHPDLVLARAVAENVITDWEAELIGATRLEKQSLAQAASVRGVSYEAAKKARQRAEHRLIAYLRGTDDNTRTDEHTHSTRVDAKATGRQVRQRLSRMAADSGVFVCGRTPTSRRGDHSAEVPPCAA